MTYVLKLAMEGQREFDELNYMLCMLEALGWILSTTC